jgi:hypothetical protein
MGAFEILSWRRTVTPSCPNGSPGMQGFMAAKRAEPARAMLKAAKATSGSSNAPSGLRRFERSRAQTPTGFKRLANAIARDAIGVPQTRKQQAEQKPPKLDPKEIDKNSYRAPAPRQRSPRDMSRRRTPGWVAVSFVLPRRTIEGLTLLTKGIANRERSERSSEPNGFRRRYPKTKNYFVVTALNYLFQQHGLSQFCVGEATPVRSRVRRFVV